MLGEQPTIVAEASGTVFVQAVALRLCLFIRLNQVFGVRFHTQCSICMVRMSVKLILFSHLLFPLV